MALPIVDRSRVEDAMRQFDQELRNTAEWQDWDKKKSQVYAIEYEGKNYPPKKIVSLSTGVPVSEFVGGAETNDFLKKNGVKTVRLRELNIDDALKTVTQTYNSARTREPFKGGNSIRELFAEIERLLSGSKLLKSYPHIKIVTSYGKGNWAIIPWISFLDDRETNTTQKGTYVDILFCANGSGCYINLAQGVTLPTAPDESTSRNSLLTKITDLRPKFLALESKGFNLSTQPNLRSESKLAKQYEAATVASKFYDIEDFPSESQILTDLNDLLRTYDEHVLSKGPIYSPDRDTRDLVLLGTWKNVIDEYENVKQAISENGSWAFWWSFRIRPEADKILKRPFYLYINSGEGKMAFRIQISEWQSSTNGEGIVSPWPSVTPVKWRGLTNEGESHSKKFITWAKATGIEKLDQILAKEDFDPAPGLSNKGNLLNQMVFGYAYLNREHEINDQNSAESLISSAPINDIVKSAYRDFEGANFRILESTVARYIASLLTKRFVILTGLSGSGKTMLAHAFASWLCKTPEDYRLIAVGADWTSNENILGYQDSLDPNCYRKPTSGALDLILRAQQNPERPFFLILDEMNLSHVERYFADILSAIESGQKICLHSAGHELKSASDDSLPVPDAIILPNNLYIVGTVNIDETTYMFSPKVLDRANVIEFRASSSEITSFLDSPSRVGRDSLACRGAKFGEAFVQAAQSPNLAELPPEFGDGRAVAKELNTQMTKLFERLQPIGAEFGFRTALEITCFFYHHAVLTGPTWRFEQALDAQVIQKLMPKLHGSHRKLYPTLMELQKFCEDNKLHLSSQKIGRMIERLTQDGFTSFAEA